MNDKTMPQKTIYSNTKRPRLIKALAIGGSIAGIALIVLDFTTDNDGVDLFIIGFWVAYAFVMTAEYKLRTVTIDVEKGIVFSRENRKYPLQISNLSYITYKEGRKGRYRGLLIHDNGTGFMDLRTPKSNADAIVTQLLGLKPDIEVRHGNYI